MEVRSFFVNDCGLLEQAASVLKGEEMRVQPSSGPGRAEWRRPSMELRIKFLTDVMQKCLADLRETTGKDGQPLLPRADLRLFVCRLAQPRRWHGPGIRRIPGRGGEAGHCQGDGA